MQAQISGASINSQYWQQLYDNIFNQPLVGITIFVIAVVVWSAVQCKNVFGTQNVNKEPIKHSISIKRLDSMKVTKTCSEEIKQESYRQQIILQLQDQGRRNRKEHERNLKNREGINKNISAFIERKTNILSQIRQTNIRLSEEQKLISNIQKNESNRQNKNKNQTKSSPQAIQIPKYQKPQNTINEIIGSKIQSKQFQSFIKRPMNIAKPSSQQERIKQSEKNAEMKINKENTNNTDVGTSERIFPNIQNIPLFASLRENQFNTAGPGQNNGFEDMRDEPKVIYPKKQIQNRINLPQIPSFPINDRTTNNITQPPTLKIEQNKHIPIIPQNPIPIAPKLNQIKIQAINNNKTQITVPIAPKPKSRLLSQELLNSYIMFVDKLREQVPISSKMQNLLGARSSPNDILIEAKSLIGTIDKNDDKQLTTFGLKLFDTIVYKFINNSNIKNGLQRIPPRSRTDQCEKTSINCYVLVVNIYRLMNQGKKVWVIVFGKLLQMLSFLYKRKQDLQSYHKLQLIQNKYIDKFKDVHGKYLSRIDFLIYMLLGMTAFDPILILRQVQQKQKSVQKSRVEVESWGNNWSYNQFWSLVSAIMSNKHQSYSKPIFFMNLLYVLYPRIYQYKTNPANFRRQYELFTIVLEKSSKYIKNFKKIKEVEILGKCEQVNGYNYDGYDFVKGISSLEVRIAQKVSQTNVNAKTFQLKANIFYYFTKEK